MRNAMFLPCASSRTFDCSEASSSSARRVRKRADTGARANASDALRAQDLELRGRAVQLFDHIAVVLPGCAQLRVVRRAHALEAAARALVFGLDALMPGFEQIESFPETIIQPLRAARFGRTHLIFSPAGRATGNLHAECYRSVAGFSCFSTSSSEVWRISVPCTM